MRLATTSLVVLLIAAPVLAQAQDVVSDGAIHASMIRHHAHHRRHHVRFPRYRHHRYHFGIALPPGTDRPGRSRTFVPAR